MTAETDDLVLLRISASAAARVINLFLGLIMADPRRFVTVDEQDISNLLKEKDSGSTKKCMKGSVRLFRAYLANSGSSKSIIVNMYVLTLLKVFIKWCYSCTNQLLFLLLFHQNGVCSV